MFRFLYAKSFSYLAAVLLFLSASILPPSPAVADDPLFDMMDSDLAEKDRTPDRAICERAGYSKDFDRWIKAYSDGHAAEAATEWNNVLKDAKGAQSLYELASITVARMEFLEGKESQLVDKTGGITGALKVILRDTLQQLGPCNKTATIADYISVRYKKSKLYKDAIAYTQKALDMRQKSLPEVDKSVFDNLLVLGELQATVHDYAAARKNAEKALEMATKAHSGAAQYKARVLLVKIPRANHQ